MKFVENFMGYWLLCTNITQENVHLYLHYSILQTTDTTCSEYTAATSTLQLVQSLQTGTHC